jgi:hypothetical protein
MDLTGRNRKTQAVEDFVVADSDVQIIYLQHV